MTKKKHVKKVKENEVLKTNLLFEQIMKKALNTPLPKKEKIKSAALRHILTVKQ